VPTSARDMGMVFQAYSLFPHMTARQIVEFGLRLRRIPSNPRRARASQVLGLWSSRTTPTVMPISCPGDNNDESPSPER